MRFDLTDLRVFLHACDAGSMTAAAERSHLTLAAVSARIRSMEDDIGLPLLERHARGVATTDAGRLVASHATAVLRQLDALRRDLASPSRGGHVAVLGNSAALARPLGTAVAAALAESPSLRVDLRESTSDLTMDALRAGIADIGIASDAADAHGIETEVLGPDPLVAIMSPSNPLAAGDAMSFEDVLRHEFVVWGGGGALRTHLSLHALRCGSTLRERAVIHSPADVALLVAGGIGLAVMPQWVANLHARPGVVSRPLSDGWARRRLLLCRRTGVPPGCHALAAHIRAAWPG
jgi:DNA-binding transcriptional LysR family regulator